MPNSYKKTENARVQSSPGTCCGHYAHSHLRRLSPFPTNSARPVFLIGCRLELPGEVVRKRHAAAVRAVPVRSHVELPVHNTWLRRTLRAQHGTVSARRALATLRCTGDEKNDGLYLEE